MNDIDLAGRVAVVTGGAQGIGRAVAARFVESGAKVHLWDFDETLVGDCAAELGDQATADAVDVTDYGAVEAAARRVSQTAGRIDILVTSAGIAGQNGPTWEYPVDAWRQIIDVNLNGTFYCARAVAPFMIQAGYGRMVLIASIAGKEGNPNACAYSASKAGVIGFTKSLGKELSDKDIAINCVTPAAARTRIFDQMSQSQIDYMLSKIPRGRFVETGEVAAMIAWLCSEENSFTTAGIFDLSGGRATY